MTTETGYSSLHIAARSLAEAGIPVFPCHVNDKRPACPNGFYNATTDLNQIDAWWSEADYNLAVVPGQNNLFVVDIDVGADTSSLELPATYTVKTPSGGAHLYYEGKGATTSHTLAPHVDTRSEGGYVLVPPSIINGNRYEALNEKPYALLPNSIIQRLAKNIQEKRKAPAGIELDTEANLNRARNFLLQSSGAVEFSGSDEQTFKIACQVRDLGISEDKALELICDYWVPRCEGIWTEDYLRNKIENAYRYAQNEAGSDAVKSAQETFGDAIEKLSLEGAASENSEIFSGHVDPSLVKYFRGREPDEDEHLSDIEFWDEERTLPKTEDGSVVIFYGQSGSMKSTVVMADILNAIQKKDAKVIYAAGEGLHGLRKARLPAACRALGITTKWLRRKFRISPAPNLTVVSEVDSFIAAHSDLMPTIIVLDTFASVSGDVEENSDKFGKLLTSSGPIGKIKRAFQCLIILIHHSGKDEGRGARGHSSILGNSDAVLRITANKQARTITKFVEKMRDGEDTFSIEYEVTPSGQPPVAKKIGKISRSSFAETEDFLGRITVTLERHDIRGDINAISTPKLARLLLELEFAELCGEPGLALTAAQEQRRKALEKQSQRAVTEQRDKFGHLVRKMGSHRTAPWLWSLPTCNGGVS